MGLPSDPIQEIPKPDTIDQVIEWFYRIGAMRAALELRLWEKLSEGGMTADEIAIQEGWDLIGTRVLLEAICAQKLLKKEGDLYSLVPESAYYLLPDKPAYQGSMLQNEFHWEGDGKLAEAIRTGKRPVQYDVTQASVTDLWKGFYSRSWAFPESFFNKTDQLWQSLGILARDGLKVLDLACGPAPRSLALARQHPGVHLTWLDWEDVLQIGLKMAKDFGLTNQVSLLPGNLWSVVYGKNKFDLAYLGNITHFFSPEENTHLFCKINEALLPGGAIIIQAVRQENENSAWDGIWLYAASATGQAYRFDEYRSMLENAGFTNMEVFKTGPIKAVKP